MGDRAVSIREFQADSDFEGMFAIAREIVSEPPYEVARRELAEYPRKHVVARVAEDSSGEIVGFCAATFPYWNDVAVIDYLVVARERRSRGIGSEIVRAVVQGLATLGARMVCVTTASWNLDGIRFYERAGFTVRARMPEYFGDRNDLVWLDRRLGKPGAAPE